MENEHQVFTYFFRHNQNIAQGCMRFPRSVVQNETQAASFRVLTRVIDSSSYDDNRLAKHASYSTLLPLPVRVDQEAMKMKVYSALSKDPSLPGPLQIV